MREATSSDPTITTVDSGGGGDEVVRTGSAPGARFGRFIVVGVLGTGGMGVVMSAFDPELDRKVALKLLHPGVGAGVEARARLQREAQAMARLAHPNAVTVYEVGRSGEHLFIAMELVDGITLRAWLRERPRPWREVLAMFVGAGRGLEAAHAAGLVHRDFKPENVLIGRDGRPRVSDFGLAESGVDADADALDGAEPGTSLGVRGVAIGTPSYMAPEQWRGGELDARTDQFAFCVALWTALWSQPPFEGDTTAELRAAVLAGRRRPAPAKGGVPGWMAPLLDRGLSIDAGKRWPSLTALLDELERRATARRRGWIGAGAAGMVAAAAAAVLITTGRHAPAAEVCPAPTARVDAIWGAARRAAVAQHLAAIDPATGSRRFAAAAALLDRGAASWTAMHVAACKATRVEGRQSDSALDARMKCLDRWLDGLSSAVAGLDGAADPGALEGAAKSVTSIGAVDRCADGAKLVAAVALPSAPGERAEAEAIAAEVMVLNTERKGNQLDGLAARSDALLVRARKLDHPTTLARALAIRWRIATGLGDIAGALAFMREETEVAARGHNDEESAATWALMGRLTAQFQGQPELAKVMIAAARAASARADDPPQLRAEVLTNEADVLVAAGDADGARRAIGEARHLLEAAGADQPGSPDAPTLAGLLQTEGEAAWSAGDLAAAETATRAAAALLDRTYGPDTVDAAGAGLDLAQILHDGNRDAEALVVVDDALRIRRLRVADESIAPALSIRSTILSGLHRTDEALAEGDRAVTLARASMPADDAALLGIIATNAMVVRDAGRIDEAAALYGEVLAGVARTELVTANAAAWSIELAVLERRRGRCARAVTILNRAVEIATAVSNPGMTADALRLRGLCEQALGRKADAIASLEGSIALPVRPQREVSNAAARGELGRLLADTGRDRARGVALVREAIAALAAAGESDPALIAWLARH